MFARIVWSVFVAVLMTTFATVVTTPAAAQVTSTGERPLRVDQAFHLSATRQDDGNIRLQWAIAPGYYLYQDKFGFARNAVDITAPQLEGNGQSKDDPTFGASIVFHDHVAAVVPLGTSMSGLLEVRYQGCQDQGICYPPIVRHVDWSVRSSRIAWR